jgi:FkbM family methyltransferase
MSLFDYEPTETEIVKSNVKKNDIAVDIGANVGYYTLLMAKNEANVFSYEPEPQNFELLKKNVSLNDFSSNVKLYNKAVSNFNGNSKLALAEHSTGQHKLGTNRFGNEAIDVEVIKLELDKIDFAKIDVEGDELHVLQGMKTLPNKMLVEFNSINLKESGSNHKDFFRFIEKYTIKQISKNRLAEPDYDQLIKNEMTTNLFLY